MNELLIDRLRTARNDAGLKQSEVAEQLGLKANTISNWEKGKTEPDIDNFVKLCNIYKIDCATLLSDVYAFERISSDISLSEYETIKKYRDLDEHGKEMVDFTLSKEYERSIAEERKNKNNNIVSIDQENTEHLVPNAAHPDENASDEERAIGDAVMMDDSEWE